MNKLNKVTNKQIDLLTQTENNKLNELNEATCRKSTKDFLSIENLKDLKDFNLNTTYVNKLDNFSCTFIINNDKYLFKCVDKKYMIGLNEYKNNSSETYLVIESFNRIIYLVKNLYTIITKQINE
jgi:hypothetical protein